MVSLQPWEVSESLKNINMDLAYLNRDKGALLTELIHEAAYRQSPLSRSLYCNPNNVSKLLNGNCVLLDFVSILADMENRTPQK